MAEPTNQAFVFDQNKFVEKLRQLESKLLEDAGKPGHNPYIQIQAKLQPLLDRLKNGEKSEQLQKDLDAVKLESTAVCAVIKEPEPQKPAPPGGLNLGTK